MNKFIADMKPIGHWDEHGIVVDDGGSFHGWVNRAMLLNKRQRVAHFFRKLIGREPGLEWFPTHKYMNDRETEEIRDYLMEKYVPVEVIKDMPVEV